MGTNCVNWFNNLRNFGVCWRITIKSRFGWLKRLYPWWNSNFFIWFDTLMICKFVKCGYSIQCLTQLKKLIFSSRSWSMPRTLVMGHKVTLTSNIFKTKQSSGTSRFCSFFSLFNSFVSWCFVTLLYILIKLCLLCSTESFNPKVSHLI